MKTTFMIFTLLTLQSTAFALSDSPLLVVEKGSLANYGRRDICEIYENHPALAGKVDQIREKIMRVSTEELRTVALFMRAQVPSEQVFAYETMISFTPQKIELESIYANHTAMITPDAQYLIDLARELCQ